MFKFLSSPLMQNFSRIQSILIAILFASLAHNTLVIILPLIMKLNGVSIGTIGWVMASYSAGFLVGSLYGYKIISRVGHIRSYTTVATIIALVAILHIFFNAIWFNGLMRFLVGVSMAIVYITLESWINVIGDRSSRGTIFAMYQLFFAMGILCAPMFALFYDPWDTRAFSMIALLLNVSIIPLLMSRYLSPEVEKNQAHLPIIEMLRDTPSGAIMSIVSGLSLSALYTLMSLFVLWLGVEDIQFIILLATATGGSIFFQVPVGRLADKFDERRVILGLVIIAFVTAIIAYSFTLRESPWTYYLVVMFIMGGSLSCIYPVSVKFIFNQIDNEKAVAAMSSLLLLNSFGLIVGPIIASTFMEWFNPSGLLIYFIGLMGLSIPFMIYRVIVSRNFANDEESIPYTIPYPILQPGITQDPFSESKLNKIRSVSIDALGSLIAFSPSKTHQHIEKHMALFNGYRSEEIVETLVLLKPRLTKPIIRAMLILYPDQAINFTRALGNLIALKKSGINRLVFEGLTHKADPETYEAIEQLFEEYTQETNAGGQNTETEDSTDNSTPAS